MTDDQLIWRIAGGSGDGIDSTSRNFAKALMRSGLDVFTHRHYPSRIRGGHTYVEVRAAEGEVRSRGDGYNVLLALGDSFARNPQEEAYYGNEELKPLYENFNDLHEGGIIVYDSGLLDEEALAAFREFSETEGIIPALEPSHAIALALKLAEEDRHDTILVNLCGRGDKDMQTAAEKFDLS